MGNTITTVICNFSTAALAGDTCQSLATEWGTNLTNFEALNPNVVCTTPLVAGSSYCVVGTVSTSTISTVSSTSTSTSSSTPLITTAPTKGCSVVATVTVTTTVTTTNLS